MRFESIDKALDVVKIKKNIEQLKPVISTALFPAACKKTRC